MGDRIKPESMIEMGQNMHASAIELLRAGYSPDQWPALKGLGIILEELE
jgi:hypothetical protein